MANPTTYSTRTHPPEQPSIDSAINTQIDIPERWRQYRAERKRRKLARWLRATAVRAHNPDPIARRHSVLLHYRAVAVRTELLQLAATLERLPDPDPECVTLLQNLLANDNGQSPLYNRNVPTSELEATLRRVRAGLETELDGPDRVDIDASRT